MSRLVAVSIVGTFLILLVAALYYARSFVLPIILALLIWLTFTPLVRYFARRGIPSAVSAILLVAAMGAGIAGTSILLADPVTQMISQAPRVADELRTRFGEIRGRMESLIRAGEQVQEMTEGSDESDRPQEVVIAQPGIVAWAADTVTGLGTTIGATLIMLVFLLSSGDLFLQKLVRVVPTLRDKKRSLRIVHDVENEVSRYLLTISVINAGFGLTVGVAMAALGMPSPTLWGLAAALLNFIPYLGALAGVSLAAAVAIVTFPTLFMAALPPLAYLVLNLLEGTVVTPLTLGRRLELNAVVILIAIAFCAWLWGIIGALIGVPILVVIKVFCDYFPSLATFGEFLSGETPPPAAPATATTPEDRDAAA